MKPMLEVKNLYVNYGNLKILQDVNLEIGQGEIVSLIGANGAGKTTLCRTVSALVKPEKGAILYHGESLTHLTPGGVVARNEPIEPISVIRIYASAITRNISVIYHSPTRKTPIVVAIPLPPLNL